MNPSEKACFTLCGACYRCSDKGKYSKCNSCSGRHDPEQKRDNYYIDDYCRCKEGVMQYRTKYGKMIIRRYVTNPFKGKFKTDGETSDERDWNQYINENREKYDDEHWDPVRFGDGTSTYDWTQNARKGTR